LVDARSTSIKPNQYGSQGTIHQKRTKGEEADVLYSVTGKRIVIQEGENALHPISSGIFVKSKP
jgi:hypothetical protein